MPFPGSVHKCVQDQDFVRVIGLQPLPRDLAFSAGEAAKRNQLPKADGTYIITGGLEV